MEQKTKKKRFNKEFKESAVKLVESGKSAAQLAREFGQLEDSRVHTWVRNARKVRNAIAPKDY